MSQNFEKAWLLFQQDRYDLAIIELQQALAIAPSARSHALMGLCLAQQQRIEDARQALATAISLDPEDSFIYFAQAIVIFSQIDTHPQQLQQALVAIETALRINPHTADYFSLKANLLLKQGDLNRTSTEVLNQPISKLFSGNSFGVKQYWEKALVTVELGLKIDSRHPGCLNLRAELLRRLGVTQGIEQAIQSSIEIDPENAIAHTQMGWHTLKQGKRQAARQYFLEALRLEPTLKWARIGVLESLKADYLIYRLISVTQKTGKFISLALIFFFVSQIFFYRLFKSTLVDYWVCLVALGWSLIGINFHIIFNAVIKNTPLGKRLLLQKEIIHANFFIGSIIIVCVTTLSGIISTYFTTNLSTRNFILFVTITLSSMSLPVLATNAISGAPAKKVMKKFSIATFISGLAGLILFNYSNTLSTIIGSVLLLCYFLAVFSSMWFAVHLAKEF